MCELDFSKNIKLIDVKLYCENISLLDFAKNTELFKLDLYCKKLSSINLLQNEALNDLVIKKAILKELDLSRNINLELLECTSTLITDLSLSGNKRIKHLNCNKNKLITVNVQNREALITPNFGSFDFRHNPNLNCIFVDDTNSKYLKQGTWIKDDHSHYVETQRDCDSLVISDDPKIDAAIRIFPNPVIDQLNILSSSNGEYVLSDINGAIVSKGEIHQGINTIKMNVKEGIYFIQTNTKQGVRLFKVVKL